MKRKPRLSGVGRSSSPHSAGLRVRALIDENTVAVAIVRANCWYSRPVMPPSMAVGTKTASSTSVVAMTGPVICCIALTVASLRSRPSSSMMRIVFSTTTIASSTTMPMASTRPNSDSVLMERPITAITANVPSSDTGMVTAGMSVVRRSCRKTYTVRTTRAIATNSVMITSRIEAVMNRVVS